MVPPMSSLRCTVFSTFFSGALSWWLCVVILGILFQSRVSGSGLKSNAIGDDNCPEQTLEEQEDGASIIFTGTVRDVFSDRKHIGQTKARVEVKRILKGSLDGRFITDFKRGDLHAVVIVDGISNPEICHSSVKASDTRIFMVNENGNELRLNSSLIRISESNLNRVDAAVKNEVIVLKPEDPEDPCVRVFCAFHAQCTINASSGQPYCSCPKLCPDVFTPVCGRDNVTYTSECHLNMASCQQQKRIQVEQRGSCSDRDACADKQCAFGAICVYSSDGIGARCRCPDHCSTHSSIPICGSDGKDYPNLCEMEKVSCTQMQSIVKKYDGKCDPCQGMNCKSGVCHVNANREAVCRCGEIICTTEFAHICASDGRTYNSECAMKRESCISRRKITKLFAGMCPKDFDPCHGLHRKPYAECLVNNGKPECVCPGNCEPVMRPVCGNDRNTYDNECMLERHSCLSEKRIALFNEGFCPQNELCGQLQCASGTVCSLINGQPLCLCPPCAQEFDPVCGSDGISYSSECTLKEESCERKDNIVLQHKGLCSTCEEKCDFYAVCQLDNRNIAQCVCPTFCVVVENQVCGTDGMTYENECELRIASCSSKKPIAIASQGTCGMCANVKCRRGARCEKGKCVCSLLCPDISDPVCASNGITYANECVMRQTGCQLAMDLEVVQSGACDDQSGSGSGLGDVCDESTCQYGGFCALDSSGFRECKCNVTCPALRQTVCGSDGKTYGSKCLMREMSCNTQKEITEQPTENCEDIFEEICEGTVPLIDPLTFKEYDCTDNLGACPPGSYCHKTTAGAKCCQEDKPISSCKDSAFGCCADGATVAPGPHKAGCPGFCQCNPLGSLTSTCDPISRQCTCKPGTDGLRCDRCQQGHWRLSTSAQGFVCLPCDCNPLGSQRDDCDQRTGRCLCREDFDGPKCNVCLNGRPLGPQGCLNESSGASLSSCESVVSCAHGAVCQMRNGTPQCLCPFACPHNDSSDPPVSVCGSHQQTFGSACQLKSFACRMRQDISVEFLGHCADGEIKREAEAEEDTGSIRDPCSEDRDCLVANSFCYYSMCICKFGFVQSDAKPFCRVETTTEPPFTRTRGRASRLTFDLLTAPNPRLPTTNLQLERSTPSATPSVAFTTRQPHGLHRSKTAKNRISGTHKRLNSNTVPSTSKTTLSSTTNLDVSTTTETTKNSTTFSTPVTFPSEKTPSGKLFTAQSLKKT